MKPYPRVEDLLEPVPRVAMPRGPWRPGARYSASLSASVE